MPRCLTGFPFLLLAVITPPLSFAQKHEKGIRPNIAISAFDVGKDVEIPEDVVGKLKAELPRRLTDTKKFNHVFTTQDFPDNQSVPTLRITGTIVASNSGNRAERYVVGFGAGAAKVVAHIRFTNIATGHTVFERVVTGKIRGGMYGGSSSGVADQLSKEIARVVKGESF
jgi:hypothetical protein